DLPRQLADGGQDDVEAGVGGREQPARVAQLRGVVDEGVAEQIADPASGGADDGLWAAAVPRARVSGEAGVEVGAALGDEAGLDAHGAARSEERRVGEEGSGRRSREADERAGRA